MENVNEYKKYITRAIGVLYPEATIYLFGSHARNTNNDRSDIDIAIDTGKPLAFHELGKVLGIINALGIPYKVDLIDLQRAPAALKTNILKDGIIWKAS